MDLGCDFNFQKIFLLATEVFNFHFILIAIHHS